MKMNELVQLDEKAMLLDKVKKFAKAHYSDADDETEALLLLFARSLKHAEEDDRRQDAEISKISQAVTQLAQRGAQ